MKISVLANNPDEAIDKLKKVAASISYAYDNFTLTEIEYEANKNINRYSYVDKED